MGGASSKVARQLPKTKTSPSWAGTRTPGFGQAPASEQPRAGPSTLSSGARPPQASDTRTEAIEQDSGDPHFLAKLNQLGPVKVDHHMQTIRPAAAHAQHVYDTRLQSEVEARSLHPSRNRLLAASLFDLLEDRKLAKSAEDVERLARRYEVDAEKLESLARYVNTPTVDPASVKRVLKEDGSEVTTFKATWVEPTLTK